MSFKFISFVDMLKIELHNRIIENKDWATLLFIICFMLITITKSAFENRFNDFKNLIFSERYIKIYKDYSHLMTWFTFLFFIVQILVFGFFIQYLCFYFGYIVKSDWLFFIKIITLLSFFILSKYLIEKIIATSFDIEEFAEQYNMLKVSYRNYTALLLLPVTVILFYNDKPTVLFLYIILLVLLFSNLLIYLKAIKLFQKIIIGKLFYFILYICTLEIAPYYFMYYWFTRT